MSKIYLILILCTFISHIAYSDNFHDASIGVMTLNLDDPGEGVSYESLGLLFGYNFSIEISEPFYFHSSFESSIVKITQVDNSGLYNDLEEFGFGLSALVGGMYELRLSKKTYLTSILKGGISLNNFGFNNPNFGLEYEINTNFKFRYKRDNYFMFGPFLRIRSHGNHFLNDSETPIGVRFSFNFS